MRKGGIFALIISMAVFGFFVCEAEAAEGVFLAGDLEVVPLGDFESMGQPGGPFTSSSKEYQLTNVGLEHIYWGIAKTADWLDFESEEEGTYLSMEDFDSDLSGALATWGELEPNESVTVTASLNAIAETLGVGVYTDALTFTDITHELEETRGVTLMVAIPGGIWVSPTYFDVNLPEGCSLTETLTIGNSGIEDLNFTLRSRETSREIVSGQSVEGTAVAAGKMAKKERIVLEYSFSKPEVSRMAGYDLVRMKGLELYERTGAPIVPVRPVTVLVPFGKEVVDSRVIVLSRRNLRGKYQLAPAQEPYPLSYRGRMRRTEPDSAIYGQAAPWPGIWHKEVTAGWKCGYQLFTLTLFPLQYTPSGGKISYATKVRLEIDLADLGGADLPRPLKRARPALNRMVDNPSSLRSYPSASGAIQSQGEVTALPDGGPYQYVIITSEALKSMPGPWNFQTLRDAKIARGVPATIVTTEWIYANYDGTRPDGGSDNQTRIRNFLIDAYQTWETEYVLLGGANSIVPARKFWVDSQAGATTTMPVDMYYGCVDPEQCTFDYDTDGSYGEPTDGVGGGDVDLYAEIYAGRATVENATELENFVYKTLSYNSTQSEYLPRVSMLGEHLGFGGVAEYAKDAMEQIRLGGNYDGYFTYGFENHIQPDYIDFDTVGCLPDNPSGCWPLYDKDGSWPKSKLIDLMNGGIHIFNHLGHANYTYDMKLYTSDLSSLTNTDYFFAYSQGCNPGGFDKTNCFAEVITSMEHGAFAVVMNARSGWGRFNSTDGPSQRFDRQFWDAVVGEDMLEIGRANQDSKEDNLWDINGGCIRWCYYELNLFGDPQQQFRFEEGCEWLTFEPESGTVGPAEANDVNVTFDAVELVPGTYEAEIIVISNDPCNPEVIVPATMTVTPDDLAVTPVEGFEPNGVRGGPFVPQCTTYTLTNNGAEAVSWMTYPTEDWLAADPCEGVLEPNESVDVNVCITPAADLLDPNVYTDILTFENIDSGSIKMRSVVLTVEPPDCFTESFDGVVGLNVDGLMLTFMPDGSSAYYEACREKISEFPTDPNGATYVSLGDDDFVEVVLDGGAEVLFYGSWYDRFYIGSNGYITFGAGDAEYSGTLENHFDMPRISALFTDLTPANNQSVSWMQLADRVVVTFKDVPLYGDKDAKNSFQIEMFFVDGTICVSWLDIAASAGVVGLSEGYGLPPYFTESNLKGYPLCWPFCDLNRDYVVGWPDLDMFVSHWLEADCNIPYWCGRADFDFSSAVDMFDWAVFAEDWLVREDWWLQPVSHWKFDEGEGTIAYDSAGDNDGNLVGDPQWVAGKIGSYALDFDGDGDYVGLADTIKNYLGVNYTVLAWIKTSTLSANHIVAGCRASGPTINPSVLFQLDQNGADARFIVRDYSGNIATAVYSNALTIDGWYHIVGVREGDTLNVYVNAVKGSPDSSTFGMIDPDSFIIGALPGISVAFDGVIDDVRVYDRALTAEEIEQLYQEGVGEKASNPYPADEATGVEPNVVLSWSPGKDALSHDVYLGTDYDDVNDADIDDPNVYMGNQEPNSWDPNGLEYEMTYYWRIDEVDDSNDRCKGDVWSFTTWAEFDPNLNLVGWWRFDEGSGTDANDSSAYGNDGTLYGAPQWVAGKVGSYALDFDGEGDYVQIPDDDSLTPSSEITIAFWLYNRGGQNAGIYKYAACPSEPSSPGASRAYHMAVIDGTGKLRLCIFSPGDNSDVIESNNTVALDQWHHIAGTFDAGEAAVYIDGQLDNSDTLSVSSIWNDAQPLIIGGCWEYCGEDSFLSNLNGKADDVRIYERALTAEEIWQLYQEGVGEKASDPYPADEAVDVDPEVVLGWSAGYGAVSHDVYFGTDYNDVNDADIDDPNVYMGNQEPNSWDPNGLEYEMTYYWRIDEVDDANDRCKGDVWSFTTWAELDPNLVGWWKFDEGSGTDANDSSDYGNHGTLYGDPNWVAGKVGSYALDFDGLDDYVDLGDKDVWDFTGSYTVSAWIYVEDWFHTDWHETIMNNRDGDSAGWRFVFDTDYSGQTPGKLAFQTIGGPVSKTANQVIYLTNWYHVVAAYDHSVEQMKLYVNAAVVNTTDANFVPSASSENLAIAKEIDRPSGNFFNGTIDDVRIYERALTAGEIEQLYQGGLN